MRITFKDIKANYLILIIKLSVLCIFGIALTRAIILTSLYWQNNIETGFEFQNLIKLVNRTSYYIPATILLIPMTGIFINKKIGWILIQSYFYYLITNLTYSTKYIDLTDNTLILINTIGLVLLLLIIILINKKKISNLIYGIEKTELISKNVIASIIGISLTIVLALIKANEI